MDLQQYVYEHIPIIKTNNFKIEVKDKNIVCVKGSYQEHINHRESVFGGSLSTALTLSAWGYVRLLMEDKNLAKAIIVIKRQEVEYLKPVTKDFVSYSKPVEPEALTKFFTTLTKFKKARLNIEAYVTHAEDGDILTNFQGEFVVVLPAKEI